MKKVFVIICCMTLMGCMTKYVTVPEVHTEYKVRTDTFIQRDSIHVSDSVTIRKKGDTVWVERWRTSWRDRWRDRIVCDTVIKTDSVAVPYLVEKRLTRWQQLKVDIGEYVMVLLAILATVFIIRIIRNRKL